MTIRLLARPAVALTALAALLLASAPAQAAVHNNADPSGDVYKKYGTTFVPAPGNVTADIRHLNVKYASDYLTMTTKLGGFAANNWLIEADVKTGAPLPYVVKFFVKNKHPHLVVLNKKQVVSCPKAYYSINKKQHTVLVAVLRSCLGTPKKVSVAEGVSVQTTAPGGGVAYLLDDAQQTGAQTSSNLVYGPSVAYN